MPKPPSLNDIRKCAAKFAHDWRDEEGYERGDAQSFVRDLLGVYGITDTRAALYERRVQRSSTAQRGYIDALVPGQLAIEMKSAGRDLSAAEQQVLDYLDSLTDAEMPHHVLSCDFQWFRLMDLKAGTTVEFALDELPKHADSLAFLAGYGVRSFGSAEQEAASAKAAKLMAGLYEMLEGTGYDDHEASVFLVRTLFALYADDSGVWERDLFTEFLTTRTAEDGSDLGAQLSVLFQALSQQRRQSNLDELVARFPYVNGGVFDGPLSIPSFDRQMRERLLAACGFHWSTISPAVFGSLFQAVKDKAARRELGEHYTTETNILKLIGPMFLDELHARFEAAHSDVRKLERLRADMGAMRFLDPACGCGNFLVVAHREMRALDLAILERLQELDPKRYRESLLFVSEQLPVRLDHFHGIEIDEWPARIAATALHLVEHQANQAMELALGKGPETLPLDKVQTITVGNALRLDWTSVVGPNEHLYVFGNPPFVGHAFRSSEQAAELADLWGRNGSGHLDYVAGWYAKALELFRRPEYKGEFAFVSTNSIAQGEPVPTLFGPILTAGWRIKFAHQTFFWTSEAPGAAAVHCIIVGFRRDQKAKPRLFTYPDLRAEPIEIPVRQLVNGYLSDGPLIFVTSRRTQLAPSLPPVAFGSMPNDGGNLIVEQTDYETVCADPVAAKYIRKFVSARELINDVPRWCLWLVDLDPSDLARSLVLKHRIEAVRSIRLESPRVTTHELAVTPHLFGENRQPITPYLGIPKTSSGSRIFLPALPLAPEVIAGSEVFTAQDPDGLAFGVVSSSAFIAWQKAVGGRLKSDMRFSATLTWNTFPLLALTDVQREAIIAGGQTVLDARALRPERSLADHYNPLAMDPALLKAHATLDRAVDAGLGLKGSVTADQRLTRLFALYEQLTTADQLALTPTRKRRSQSTRRAKADRAGSADG